MMLGHTGHGKEDKRCIWTVNGTVWQNAASEWGHSTDVRGGGGNTDDPAGVFCKKVEPGSTSATS